MSRLLAALVCLAVISAVPAAPVPTHLMPKDPPLVIPTRVGTTWVYGGPYGKLTVVITEVKEEKGGVQLVTTECAHENGKRMPHMVTRVSAAGAFLVAEGGQKYGEPWCLIKLPHSPGRTWETKLSGNAVGTGTMTAGPMEEVKVPAGEFSAAPVTWEFTPTEGGKRKDVYWYANGIGLVRMNDKQELTSFTPGKDK